MWRRIAEVLRCPVCDHSLQLQSFQEESIALAPEHTAQANKLGLLNADFNRYVNAGALLCETCSIVFPIIHGLPVLIPYTTPIHQEFATTFREQLQSLSAYKFAALQPVSGEQFVMSSFSTEWLEYDYDGVIWDLSYEDHEKRFLSEIGPNALRDGQDGTFLEIGCGIGLTTNFAAKNLHGDAIGVDLSLAVLRATQQFRTNPFLHFVQASAFYLPLKKEVANVMYTHGVLHHTYSTEKAFHAVAPCCAQRGWLYVWFYGHESERGSPLRRLAFAAETRIRPMIARNLSSPLSKASLSLMARGYMVVNQFHRLMDSTVAGYNYRQALHAARDRFTPLYAYRQDYPEVASWFKAAGFEDIEQVDWRTMPTANQDNYRRNTGVRGKRPVAGVAGSR